jgi:hypothetical protein
MYKISILTDNIFNLCSNTTFDKSLVSLLWEIQYQDLIQYLLRVSFDIVSFDIKINVSHWQYCLLCFDCLKYYRSHRRIVLLYRYIYIITPSLHWKHLNFKKIRAKFVNISCKKSWKQVSAEDNIFLAEASPIADRRK